MAPVAAAAVILPSPGSVAHAQAPLRNILVVDVPGTTLEDWMAAPMPALRSLMHRGATGLLSAGRPACSAGDRPLRAAVERELTPLGVDLDHRDARLADAGFPTGTRTDLDAIAATPFHRRRPVAMVDIDDALRADCSVPAADRDRWVRLSLERADRFIGSVSRLLDEGATLVVVSSVAPNERGSRGNRLTAAVAVGPSFEPGSLLTSATTRRAGIVAIGDVPATIARLEGATSRISKVRALRSTPGSVAELLPRSRRYAHALALRSRLLRWYVGFSSSAIFAAMLLVLSGRGRSSRRRLPRTARDAAGVALTTVVAVPAVGLLEPLLDIGSTAGSLLAVFLAAVAVAVAARAIVGARRVVPVVAAVTMVAVAADLAAGAPLASRSAMSYTIASGPRFHGIGNELMGVVVAASLLWAAAALDRTARRPASVCAVLAAVAALMAAPMVGAKFGSTFVAVPAFGLLAVRAFGADPRRGPAILGIAIATVLVAGVAALADFLSSPQTQTLVSNVAASGASDVLGDKVGAALRLAAASYWTGGIAIAAGAATLIAARRRALAARALWGHPHLRAALAAAAVACVTAVAFNDAGVVAAAFIALIVAAAGAHLMVVENAGG